MTEFYLNYKGCKIAPSLGGNRTHSNPIHRRERRRLSQRAMWLTPRHGEQPAVRLHLISLNGCGFESNQLQSHRTKHNYYQIFFARSLGEMLTFAGRIIKTTESTSVSMKNGRLWADSNRLHSQVSWVSMPGAGSDGQGIGHEGWVGIRFDLASDGQRKSHCPPNRRLCWPLTSRFSR